MQITGIIAEYNPLHLGHQFHITETRKQTGADYIVTVLSGDFVQRGLPAILDKHIRTRMALEAGSDLVLELPVPYALSSGEGFGFGGVSLLHQLGCINSLSFGSEAGELNSLMPIAQVLQLEDVSEHTSYHAAYQSALKQGLTHPAARIQALNKAYPELNTAALDGHSNNMLALEYCKAICRLNSPIQPVTIKRQGQDYLQSSVCPGGHFASATAIREALSQKNMQVLAKQVPSHVAQTVSQALSENRLLFPDDFSALLHYKLLMLSKEALSDYWEVTSDLANKIVKNLSSFENYTQFANLLWTKDTTYARVCRTLMHILLDIRNDTWNVHQPVPYAKVLGFRKNAAPLLTEIKKSTCIPLITKLADAEKALSPESRQLLSLDIKAAHIYDSVVLQKSNQKANHEMQKQIVIL